MNQTTLRLRGSAAAAFATAAVASMVVACSGDDNATTPPDAGSTASSSSSSSSSPHDGGTASDATVTDAAVEAEAEAEAAPPPVQPLDWCSLLLFDFDQAPDSGTPLPDGGFRYNSLDNNPGLGFGEDIVIDPGNPQSFIPALNADCHFGGLTPIVVAGTPDGGPNSANQWYGQIDAFTVGLFGCNQPGLGQIDAGNATIRDLLPPGQADQTLTQADVNDLVNTYVTAVISEVAFQDFGMYNGGTLLTADQIEQLQATVNAIAAATPNVTPSLTTYTYDACSSDAGSDAQGD